MKRDKIGALFLISVLALSGIGIAYAGWTDTIFVSGTVQTGYVGFEVSEYSGTWVWKIIDDHTKEVNYGVPVNVDEDPNGHYDDPDDYMLVAHSYAYDDDATDADVDFKFIKLFPCVDFEVDFKFTIGTIPVFLTGAGITWSAQTVDGVEQDWIEGLPGDVPAPTVTEAIYDGDVLIWEPNMQGVIQLHPGVTYRWVLIIHIPQCNAYMNAYAEGSCTFDIIQWSDTCDGTLPDKDPILASSDTQFQCKFTNYPWQYETGRYCYFKNTLSGLWSQGQTNQDGQEYNVWNGAWVAWCVDNTGPGHEVNLNKLYNAHMFSSYDIPDTLPNGVQKSDHTDPNDPTDPYKWMNDPDWPYVNWIINNKPASHSWQDVQQAIWYFVDGGAVPTDPQAVALKDAALANCNPATYHPQAGENVAVIIWINPSVPYPGQTSGTQGHHQVTIIEVDP